MRKAILIMVVFMTLVSIGCGTNKGGETVAGDAASEKVAEPREEKKEEKQEVDGGVAEGDTKEGGVALPGGGTNKD